jgi:uncharacterized protein (DUF302 family)
MASLLPIPAASEFHAANLWGLFMSIRQWVFVIVLLLSILSLPQIASTADPGFVTKPSSYSVQETIERFENAVKAKGQIVFGRVDHAEAAAKYGIEFRPHTTVLFGRPQNGTPLMRQAGTYTIDAPQKVAVWQDDQGKVWLTYNSAEYFATHLLPRHGLSFSADQVTNLQQFMDQVTDQATK